MVAGLEYLDRELVAGQPHKQPFHAIKQEAKAGLAVQMGAMEEVTVLQGTAEHTGAVVVAVIVPQAHAEATVQFV